MKIKQEDIAQKLGVSRTTVARALNGSDNIKKETKTQILEMIEKMGYKKNIISSSLATKKKREVYCFLVKSINENYCGELKKGLLEVANEFKEYNIGIKIIETLIDEPQNQIEALKEIIEEKMPNGIIITPLLKKEIKNIILNYEEKIKFITLDAAINEEIYHVGADYFYSGEVAANIMDQLLRKDEKIILFSSENDNISTEKYYNGFKSKALTTNKIIIDAGKMDKNFENLLNNILSISENNEVIGLYTPRYLPEFISFLIDKKIDLSKFKIVGNGNNKKLIEYLDKGYISSLVHEQNILEGYTCGKYMFNFLLQGVNPKKKKTLTTPIIKFKN